MHTLEKKFAEQSPDKSANFRISFDDGDQRALRHPVTHRQ